MKDEEFLFHEDVREKAITARSARKRPSHSGCKLPHYTAKELRELNGPTYTVNLNKPMTYAAFKALPENLRKEYIQNLIAKYEVGPSEISRLLGADVKTCSAMLRKLDFRFGKGHKPSADGIARLRADYGMTEVDDVAPTKKMTLQNISFSFAGAFDAVAFAKQLKTFIPEGQELRISVAVEVALPEQP